jgi:predicted alpha/beta superfamily hydrolase
MKKAILFSLLLYAFGQIIAQNIAVPVINQQQQYSIKSTITGNTYQLYISLPMNYSAKDSLHYAVLYLLDGNINFPIIHSTRTNQDFCDMLENIIIVGIGYTWDQSFVPWWSGRWTDFTPTPDVKVDTFSGVLKGLNLQKGALQSGGANAFIQSMKKEIMPLIEDKYKTNGDNGIAGHSIGGLFAGYCLLIKPTLFKRYGILSPSFWWDNDKIFEIEKTYSENNQSLPVNVFISVGSLEGKMVEIVNKFADSLKTHHYKGLTLHEQIFDNEDHVSVIPASLSRTLRVLYPKKK